MKYTRYILAVCVLLLIGLVTSAADAFTILSPRTDACHEHLMLGSLGAAEDPFRGPSSPGVSLLDRFSAKVEALGVPADEVTDAFIVEAVERYGLQGRPRAEQYVLASFVAGVRQPDTEGLSVVEFNETRSIHLQDQNQPLHALRKTGHDHEKGDAQAIADARQIVVDRVERAVASWLPSSSAAGRLYAPKRWTFSFYGDADVTMFAPAFELGQAAHVVQDAFAHSLRDEEMRITAVANFVDVIQEQYDEPRDGPGHSDRLDECDVANSPFDHMRIVEARDATAGLLAVTDAIIEEEIEADAIEKYLSPELDRVFELRDGCTLENDYCDSDWKELAESDLTEPYELTFCSVGPAGLDGSLADDRRTPSALVVLLVVSALAVRCRLRSRSRRSTA